MVRCSVWANRWSLLELEEMGQREKLMAAIRYLAGNDKLWC